MRISDWSSDVCSSDLAQVPRVRADVLAAGLHLPGDAADHPGAGAVLRHRPARPRVVRLCLPADGVDGSVPVDGALDRGRPREANEARRSEEHTSELQSLMRSSYAVLCLKQKNEGTSP